MNTSYRPGAKLQSNASLIPSIQRPSVTNRNTISLHQRETTVTGEDATAAHSGLLARCTVDHHLTPRRTVGKIPALTATSGFDERWASGGIRGC